MRRGPDTLFAGASETPPVYVEMLSAKQFASGEGRLADVKGERCDFAVVGARKFSAAGGSPSGSRAIFGGAGFAIVLGVTIMATRRRWEPYGHSLGLLCCERKADPDHGCHQWHWLGGGSTALAHSWCARLAASYSFTVMIALLAVILSDRHYRDLFPDSGKESRSASKIELVSKNSRGRTRVWRHLYPLPGSLYWCCGHKVQ